MDTEIKTSNGVYKLRVPIKYVKEDASDDDKEILRGLKERVEYVVKNGGVVVLPAVRDDNGNPLFDLEYVGP